MIKMGRPNHGLLVMGLTRRTTCRTSSHTCGGERADRCCPANLVAASFIEAMQLIPSIDVVHFYPVSIHRGQLRSNASCHFISDAARAINLADYLPRNCQLRSWHFPVRPTLMYDQCSFPPRLACAWTISSLYDLALI